VGKLIHASAERMLRIEPPPLAEIFGAKARMTERVPKKCVSISRRILSRSGEEVLAGG
jgi:hypothetical protein